MEFHQLRYFLAVADEGNFTRAAAKSFVSQPSLSAQIIKLEEELGQKLFDRLGRRAELTDAGRFLERRARRILMEVENAQLEIGEAASEVKGKVRVGFTPSIGSYIIPEVIAICRDRYPELEIEVEEALRNRLIEEVLEGNLELALSSYSGGSPHLDVEPILQEDLRLVLPREHPLVSKERISIKDFKDEPLIALGEANTVGEKLVELFGRNEVEPKIIGYCSQLNTVKALVHQGVGLSILPEMSEEEHSPYDIVFRPLISERMMRLVFLMTNNRRYLPAGARAFIETLRDYVDSREW
ncbi:MAG: LysR substrate-binding domain-containing protein [Verrucomicrobiota bacterium]